MWLGGEDVDGVHVALCLAAVLEALDVGDVGVEDVIFLDDVVYELLGVFVDDEDLPLRAVLVLVRRGTGHAHVAAGHLADGVEDDCIACQLGCPTRCALYTGTYALAGYRSWTPSWRGTAASAGRMQWDVKGGGSGRSAKDGAMCWAWLLARIGAGLHARRCRVWGSSQLDGVAGRAAEDPCQRGELPEVN